MVEVDVTLGKLPNTKTEEIKTIDQKRIIPYLKRSKYKLFASFLSATMVHPNDSPIEFEVSIGGNLQTWCQCICVILFSLRSHAGNYGNKLDENSPVQPSTTPPSNPIFDGNSYYYLPWKEQKPCIQVCAPIVNGVTLSEVIRVLIVFSLRYTQAPLYIGSMLSSYLAVFRNK